MAVQPDTARAPCAQPTRPIPFTQRPDYVPSAPAPRIGRELARELRELALLASVVAADMPHDIDDAACMMAAEIGHLLDRTSTRNQSVHFLSGSLFLRLVAVRKDLLEARTVTVPDHAAQLFRGFAARLNAMGAL